MTSFFVLIYVCASATTPLDCNRHTAIDVVVGPEARSELYCGLGAQEMIAQTAVRPRDGEYIKISCERRGQVAEN